MEEPLFEQHAVWDKMSSFHSKLIDKKMKNIKM